MITDTGLQDQVLNELTWERLVDSTKIRVEVHDGYVRLAGQVDSEEARSAAEWAARRVAGIKGVESELVVVSPPPRIIQ
jgi:osmotically-inducible protein OsmY